MDSSVSHVDQATLGNMENLQFEKHEMMKQLISPKTKATNHVKVALKNVK